jgi:hypothetical protein
MLKPLATLLLLGSLLVGPAFAEEGFQIIHVEDLSKLIASPPKALAVYDANPASTREREGVIPGAHLLASSVSYDVAKELPPDKDTKLVFYCANTH